MKRLTEYINEKLVINKNYKRTYTYAPASWYELREIIEQRYEEQGPGTKQNPIDFNDIAVSNVDTFYNRDNNNGLFEGTKIKYINISDWNVSNVKNMNDMFYGCKQLKSIGDLSNWDVSKVEDMSYMFYMCHNLISVSDLSGWNVSKVEYMNFMFYDCEKLQSVGDLSNWNVSKIKYMSGMFYGCKQLKSVGDLSRWNFSNVNDMFGMFKESGITNTPNWYKK